MAVLNPYDLLGNDAEDLQTDFPGTDDDNSQSRNPPSLSSSAVTHQWPQSFREAVDIFSIFASRNFGILRHRISGAGSLVITNHNLLEANGKIPLPVVYKKPHHVEDLHRSRTQSIYSDTALLAQQRELEFTTVVSW